MIKVYNRLQKEKLDAKLILQVHDELIVEAIESEKEQVEKILTEEMENACKMKVRLKADVQSGKTWYDCKWLLLFYVQVTPAEALWQKGYSKK